MKVLPCSLFLCVVAVTPVYAVTIQVPGDYPTVQAAIDAAADGDTIQVAPGTYVERVVINKAVAVRGSGRSASFLLGTGAFDTVRIEANGAVLSDFDVTGRILVWCSKPTVERNAIHGSADYGVYAYTYPYWNPNCHGSADATIQNNDIYDNDVGVAVFYASPVIRNNFIVRNVHASVSSAYFALPTIINNTIANNGGVGVRNWAYTRPTVSNNIIAHNGGVGMLNSYNSWSFAPSYNVSFENQIADYASEQSGEAIVPESTEIHADPALVHVPRWSSAGHLNVFDSYFGSCGTDTSCGPPSLGHFKVGGFIQLSFDDFPRVITRVDGLTVYFKPALARVPMDGGRASYWSLVSYLAHDRDLSFDWRLSSGSAVINACDPDPALADRDGSRNDCGATGGPHSEW